MGVTEHFVKGKTAIVGVTSEGFIFNANIEDFTILEDDGYSDDMWEIGDYNRVRDTTWRIQGRMVPINDRGAIYEVRKSND